MAKDAATWRKHSQNPNYLVLLICLLFMVQSDTHILSCNITLKTCSTPREFLPQCSVDEVLLRSNDKDNTRMEGNVPKECEDLFPKLKDIKEEFRSQLHTMEQEGDLTRGNHSLQVTMVSQYKEGKFIDAFCNFTLDEQYSFIFYLKNRKWTVIHNNIPGIDKWQDNTELVQHLETFYIGDGGRCLKKMPRYTSRAPDIVNVTSPTQLPSTMNATQLPSTMNATQLPSTMNTTQLPSTTQPPSKEGSGVTAALISISIIIVIILSVIIYKCVKRNSSQRGRCAAFVEIAGVRAPEPCSEETISMVLTSPPEGDSPHRSSASSS